MVRVSYNVLELSDGIAGRNELEKVFWLSRHTLTSEQEKVLFYTHGPIVVECRKMLYPNETYFYNLIQKLSRQGLVYAVIPQSYIQYINKGLCPDLTLRTFLMSPNLEYWATIEHRVAAGVYSSSRVFDARDFSYFSCRERTSAHFAGTHPVCS